MYMGVETKACIGQAVESSPSAGGGLVSE